MVGLNKQSRRVTLGWVPLSEILNTKQSINPKTLSTVEESRVAALDLSSVGRGLSVRWLLSTVYGTFVNQMVPVPVQEG